MATRALVGFIHDLSGQPVLISTYNHYDGYPENLGKALENHYSMPEEALKIASMGYISYINPESGEIEAKHKEPADKTPLGDNFEEAMFKVAETADSYGADYVYIYNVEESGWNHVKMYGIAQTAEALMRELSELDGGIFGPSLDDMNEDFTTKWKKFINETEFEDAEGEGGNNDLDKVLSQVMFQLQDDPKHMVKAYMDSVANDIRLNGQDSYLGWGVADFIEDYENYIADKMDY